MNATRRTLSTLVVLAMLLTMTAIPAFAMAVGSATITSGDLISGQSGLFTVQITNNGVSGSSVPIVGSEGDGEIDAVVIEVPSSVFVANGVTLPANWSGEYDADIGFVFAWADAPEHALGTGSSFTFDVLGAARAIPDDRSANVPVFVSDDGGMTLSSAGTPTLTSRILEVVTTQVKKPTAAVNQDRTQVTEGQTNATVRVGVVNHGTQARTVEIDAEVAGNAGTTVTPAPLTLAPGERNGLNLVTTFGDAGTVNLTGVASSTNSTAIPLDGPQVTIQEAFDGTYVSDSLAPRSVIQGTSVTFSLDVNKTGAQPAGLTTTLTAATTPALSTSTTTNFGAGNGQTTLTFPAVTIPADDNGDYGTSLRATGVDHNGAAVDVTLTPDALTLDNLVPVVTLSADVGMTTVAGADRATTDGREITFSGEVRTGSDDGSAGELCGDCEIVLSEVRAFDAAGNRITADLDFPLTNDGGRLSGAGSFDFPDGTITAIAVARAEKTNGTPSDLARTAPFDVDLIAPQLVSAVTGRDGTGDHITVFLTELVDANGVSGADFTIDDNTVLAVTASPQTNGATQLRLELARELGDNDTPSVEYAPNSLLGQRMTDRVDLPVADKLLEAIDGIVPEAPVIQTVNGYGLQDDAYWSNVRNPTVTLTNMVPGDTLFLYFDTNGNGIPENSEKVFQGAASGETETVTLPDNALPATDTEGVLIARMFDAVGFGDLDSDPLNLDYSDPVIVSFAQTGNQVTVTFSESLPRGRDAAFDWTVQAGGASRTVTSVSGAGETRTLQVSSSSYDEALLGPISGVRFKYRGPSTMRYNDRATNTLADQVAAS